MYLAHTDSIIQAPLVIQHCPLTVHLNRISNQLPLSFSSHDRLLRAMSSKDALVKDLKARIEVLTAREKSQSTAPANDLAKEKAKYKDSWKTERDSDVKDDRERTLKPFVSSFGGGPPRCGTPTRFPPPPPSPPPSGLTGGISTGNIRVAGSKDVPKGFDSDVAELEIIAATAHLSASELRNR